MRNRTGLGFRELRLKCRKLWTKDYRSYRKSSSMGGMAETTMKPECEPKSFQRWSFVRDVLLDTGMMRDL